MGYNYKNARSAYDDGGSTDQMVDEERHLNVRTQVVMKKKLG